MRDDIDLTYFKQLLQRRLKQITGNRKTIEPVNLDQTRVGRLSRMDAMLQQAMAQAGERIVLAEERRIRTALDHMKSGDYGYCMNCDEEISEGRLRVDPSVLTCIACAQEAEDR